MLLFLFATFPYMFFIKHIKNIFASKILNGIRIYAKDKIIRLPKYLATFSIVFNVIEVFSGSKIRQIAVLDVSFQ